jgi:anti-sigma factor RsiW
VSGCGPAAGQREEPECDPGLVFELADGTLAPEETRSVRRHLDSCAGCRELYARERALSRSLKSADFAADFDSSRHSPSSCAIHRAVAMSLPTRRPLVRLLWAALAVGVILWAVLLIIGATEAVVSLVDLFAAVGGLVGSAVEVSRAVLAAVGPVLLLILAVGAVADLLIACGVLFARRSRARQRRPGRA